MQYLSQKALKRNRQEFTEGDRVMFHRQWLRDTQQFTGTVPFMRGTVLGSAGRLVEVSWDAGCISNVLNSNLEGRC